MREVRTNRFGDAPCWAENLAIRHEAARYTFAMFSAINDHDRNDAGSLWGVRICAILVGFGALAAAIGCVLLLMLTFVTLTQRALADGMKSLLMLLCCIALTYALLRICVGLFNGSRFGQLGGILWGIVLLLFCWMLVHDARGPYNPKAPDAQELNGPIFLLSAPTSLWLIGYLSTRRVSAKFLDSKG
jgi:hypothetical protein